MKRLSVKFSILVCWVILINFTGCGIKGNPVISSAPDHAQIVQNIKAVSSGDAVILKWDIYNKDSRANYIAIEKSELGRAGNECKDCPRTFERIGQVPIKEATQKNNEYNSFSFSDTKVIRGKTYNYRLMMCDDFNTCSESSTAEINFK